MILNNFTKAILYIIPITSSQQLFQKQIQKLQDLPTIPPPQIPAQYHKSQIIMQTKTQTANTKLHYIEYRQQQIQITNKARVYIYCCILCLSTTFFGYSLTIISSSAYNMIVSYYHAEHLNKQEILSVLNGILPFGGMVGCFFNKFFIRITTRKKTFYVLTALTIGQCGASIIPQYEILIMSRFVLGVLNALSIACCYAFIKQSFPPRLRKKFGAIYSAFRILGMLLCYSIAEISKYSQDETQHLIIFFGPGMITLIQSILVYLFLPNSFIELVRFNKKQELTVQLSKIYKAEVVEMRIQQLVAFLQDQKATNKNEQLPKLTKNKNLSAYHLALLRQFCGATYIVVYAGQVMREMKSPLAGVTPVIINSIQFAAGVIGIFLVDVFHRRRMVIFSTISLAVLTLVIGISDYLQQPIFLLTAMTIFMIPCGASLTSVAWSYPNELIQTSKSKFPSLISWAGSTLVTTIPPYIVAVVPGNNAYPIFFFFTGYLVLAAVFNYFMLVEITHYKKNVMEMSNREMLME